MMMHTGLNWLRMGYNFCFGLTMVSLIIHIITNDFFKIRNKDGKQDNLSLNTMHMKWGEV
jgi:hypothetical protein